VPNQSCQSSCLCPCGLQHLGVRQCLQADSRPPAGDIGDQATTGARKDRDHEYALLTLPDVVVCGEERRRLDSAPILRDLVGQLLGRRIVSLLRCQLDPGGSSNPILALRIERQAEHKSGSFSKELLQRISRD
jgi:hypothetical protein